MSDHKYMRVHPEDWAEIRAASRRKDARIAELEAELSLAESDRDDARQRHAASEEAARTAEARLAAVIALCNPITFEPGPFRPYLAKIRAAATTDNA